MYFDDVASGKISTHSLTRRLTISSILSIRVLQYFNSQPHKEADSNFIQ